MAIVPFPSEKDVTGEIEAAGGMSNWQLKQPLATDDFQRKLWLATKAEWIDQPGRVPLVLAYEIGDRFAPGTDCLLRSCHRTGFKIFGVHS